jgi:arylsulfatase A-like enzyme
MYEESLRMPFVIRYPREIAAGTTNQDIVCNVDFAPLFLDVAGVDIPAEMQGRSFRSMFESQTPADWRTALYYRYWMHKAHHNVYAHYGLRTHNYKLIYYYADALGQAGAIDETYEPEWELFDLKQDPYELQNVYHDPAYADTVRALTLELHRLQAEYGDERYEKDVDF